MTSSHKHAAKKNKQSLFEKLRAWKKIYLNKKFIITHKKSFFILAGVLLLVLIIGAFSFSTNTQLSKTLRATFRETYPILGEQEYQGETVPITCRDSYSCNCVPSEDDDGTCRNLFGCTDCGVNGQVCSVKTGACVVPQSKDDVIPIVQGWEKGKPVTCIGTASFFCLNPDEETGECESLGRNEDCAERGGLCRNGVCQHVAHTAQGTQEVRGQEQPVVCVNDNTISCVCTGASGVGDPCTETTLCQPCRGGCDAATGQCNEQSTADEQNDPEPTEPEETDSEEELDSRELDQDEDAATANLDEIFEEGTSSTETDTQSDDEATDEDESRMEEQEEGENTQVLEGISPPADGVTNCNEAVTETSCPGGRVYMGSYCDEETYLCHRACECRNEDGSLKAGCREDEIGTDNYYPETDIACTVE